MTAAATPPAPSRPRPLPTQHTPAVPPPFFLPAGHFAVALGWLVLGAIGLVTVAPDLARGNFLDPHVFAVVHTFTLGVIVTVIFGVMHQFLPMALGISTRSIRAGYLGLASLTLGTAALVTGFWASTAVFEGVGWTLVFVAIGLHTWNLPTRRAHRPETRAIRGHLAAAHTSLGLALALAGARIGENLGWWSVDRMGIIAAHFHLAALGFATLTAVGVGSRMVPMFLVSHGTPQWPMRYIAPLGLAGLVAFSVGEVWHFPALSVAGAALMAAAAALYLHLSLGHFRRRLRRALDPAVAHMATGFGALALATGLGVLLVALPSAHPRLWIAYALLAVLGWLVTLILGVLYKILSHLGWIHFYGARTGTQAITVAQMLSPAWAWTSLACLSVGLLALVTSILAGSPAAATAGAALWAIGAVLVPAHYIRMFTR
ncbi:MAG TPA: hypothetical protein VLC11_01300 [Gemmatimonadales bacterium]|nr:hypothetical protein [Gemmatimonadales bacterium]